MKTTNQINSGRFQYLCLALTFLFIIISYTRSEAQGNPVNKDYDVSGFHGIEVSGGFDLLLSQGSAESVTITAKESLYDNIYVEVSGGILKIYTKDLHMSTGPMKAHVSCIQIDNLKVSGGGDVSFETPLNVPALNLVLSGGGDLSSIFNTGKLSGLISGGGDARINGEIKNMDLQMSGGGDLSTEIETEHISCQISGGGDFRISASEKVQDALISMSGGGDLALNMTAGNLKCSLSGGGDCTLSGQAELLELSISGGGDANASGLKSQNVIFSANGGSDIYLNATENLEGKISGGGKLYYSGNPRNVSVDKSGGSEIHKE